MITDLLHSIHPQNYYSRSRPVKRSPIPPLLLWAPRAWQSSICPTRLTSHLSTPSAGTFWCTTGKFTITANSERSSKRKDTDFVLPATPKYCSGHTKLGAYNVFSGLRG